MGHFTTRVLILLAADGQAFEFDLPQHRRRLAAVDDLRLGGHDWVSSKLLISLTARADSVARTADRAVPRRDTTGRCSQRLWRIGETPFRWVQSRLWRDARHVDWRLIIHPARIKDLSISARVDDVERLPDSLEAAFGVP